MLVIVFAVIWTIYLLTLAPELTLEDSGELCTGSFYAGIPHPPGYPFWAIYSWFWTAILPIGNVAWRVEVGESFAVAMGCGMLALMVSRGSSMLIEGIEELNSITSKWENAICMVSGFVAGMMLGLDGFMWSESVVINRISLFAVPWLILVLLMLMRWMYAPHQRRYLYLAMFFYGICATIHQTLLLSAMGIEVAIAAAQPRLGRDLFLTNSICYLIGLYALSNHSIPALNNMTSIENAIFHVVGVGSIFAGGWLSLKTEGNLFRMEVGLLHGTALGARRVVLFLRADFRHDRPADAMGLSAHGGRLFSRVEPRPVRNLAWHEHLPGPDPLCEPALVSGSGPFRIIQLGLHVCRRCCRFCFCSKCTSGSVPGSSA